MSVIIPGSFKPAHPAANVGEALDPSTPTQITIVVRDGRSPAPIVQWAAGKGWDVEQRGADVVCRAMAGELTEAFSAPLATATTASGQFITRVPAGATGASLSLPDEAAGLLPAIVAVLGLDTRPAARPYTRFHNFHAAPNPEYAVASIGQFYGLPTDVNGAGYTAAVIELGGGYANADLTAAGCNPNNAFFKGIDGAVNAYSGNPNSADGEVGLDMQIIMGLAPGARCGVYTGQNTSQSFYNTIGAALADGVNVISISWGQQEAGWALGEAQAYDQLFGRCLAAGCPVFVASGDNGSSDGGSGNNVDFPASAPNAIGCGGTAIGNPEVVWNDPGGGASGGGTSAFFSRPSYQNGINIAGGMRCVPDVTSDGAPSTGYAIYIRGWAQFGGTSASAPFFAACSLLALSKGYKLGDLHSRFYGALGTSAWRDITQGNNGAWQAGPGYDCASGCGSPNGLAPFASNGTPTPSVTLSISGPLSVDAGSTATYSATLTPDDPGASISWYVNGTFIGSGASVRLTPTASFTLLCAVTLSDGLKVSTSSAVTVNAGPPPAPAPSGTVTVAAVTAYLNTLAQYVATYGQAYAYTEYVVDWVWDNMAASGLAAPRQGA